MNDHPIAYEIMANINMEPGIIFNLLSLLKYSASIRIPIKKIIFLKYEIYIGNFLQNNLYSISDPTLKK